MDMQQQRRGMVDRLRQDGIDDERVLAAMASVPREQLLPTKAAGQAYAEQSITIGAGQSFY